MQKFIRVMAITATVLVVLSLLLLLVSIPFQSQIAAKIYKFPEELTDMLPMFPLSQFVHTFLLLGCSALMIVCCGNQKGGIWLEILLLATLILVVPFINKVLSDVQNVFIGQVGGGSVVAANSVVNQISSYCAWPSALGNSLALVAGGMSMAYKRMDKKLAKVTE